jgi:protein C (EC:3.4.21.69). Serine peptidase. MEROPS family S49
MNLPHLASRLYGTPLLLARAKLDVILSVLGERVNWPESDLAVPSIQKRPSIDAPVGIAVIPVVGSLVRRTVGLDPASGFTSYAEIAGMVDAALADASVEGIVLDIDSPGGEAGACSNLAIGFELPMPSSRSGQLLPIPHSRQPMRLAVQPRA